FDRRYMVFDAARTLLVRVVQNDRVEVKWVMDFNGATADASFLFESEIVEYLDSLRSGILALRVWLERLHAIDERDDAKDEKERNNLINRIAERELALSAELPNMIEKFKPYLKLGRLVDRHKMLGGL